LLPLSFQRELDIRLNVLHEIEKRGAHQQRLQCGVYVATRGPVDEAAWLHVDGLEVYVVTDQVFCGRTAGISGEHVTGGWGGTLTTQIFQIVRIVAGDIRVWRRADEREWRFVFVGLVGDWRLGHGVTGLLVPFRIRTCVGNVLYKNPNIIVLMVEFIKQSCP